ncbi:hypothetical protein ABIE44_002959 [Marmoricola sp. OAE513]|uniref:hypothetical protein n=1 Tax=Marmoricola sp. OAE513 TaxID=2817894 RepID=UPI001AE671B7
MKTRPRALAATACVLLALSVSACGSSKDESTREVKGDLTATPAAQVTASPAADAKVIEITLDGKTVEPSALRVEVKLNQPVVLKISSTEDGQLHVHSTPEHQVDFAKGDSEITLTFDQPGVVDVEDHALDKLIAQLEVS